MSVQLLLHLQPLELFAILNFLGKKNLLNEFCLLLAGCSALVLDWEGSYARGARLAF